VRLEHGAAGDQRVGSLDALARKIADEVASVRAYFTACAGSVAELPGAQAERAPLRDERAGVLQ
jgi:hypothetical protein